MRYVAFLRGINVGGHKKILMADLKELFISAGFTLPATYIQSGNIAFNSSKKPLTKMMEQLLLSHYHFDVSVILRTPAQLAEIIANNPFPAVPDTKLYIHLLSSAPTDQEAVAIEALSNELETIRVIDQEIYLSVPSYAQTKLINTFFEKKLNGKITTRNLATITKCSTL